jgi:DNA repair exonuclease SbcCD nuclease subunit
MDKVIVVGDFHCVAGELPECERLIEYIYSIQKIENAQKIIFLGDQYHSHANIHLYVLDFWHKTLKELKSHFKDVICLVGNHDQPGGTPENIVQHAMKVHQHDVNVIDQPKVIDNVLYLPYYGTSDIFYKHLNSVKEPYKGIVAHQTLEGAAYENGFYAKDGINVTDIPQWIVSGHLHKTQYIGKKVFYPGSPRWRQLTDANSNKYIWVMELGDDCKVLKKYDTSRVCTPIYHLELNQSSSLEKPTQEGNYVVDLHGSEKFIKDNIQSIKQWAKVRVYPEITTKLTVRESEGVHKSLFDYMDKMEIKNGTNLTVLKETTLERLQHVQAR